MTPTALVTGAGRGFGRGLAEELFNRGWSVVALVRRRPGDALPITYLVGDVTHDATANRIRIALEGRPLHLLVNNAGIDGGSNLPEEVDPAIVLEMAAVHAAGAARMMRAAWPALVRGAPSRIVNVSSRLGSLTHAAEGRYRHLDQSIAYRMAKASLNMLTLASAEVLEASGIDICAVHPGRLRTKMAAPDADIDVDVAARRMLDWLDSGEVAGRFYSLDTESDLPW